MIYELLELLRIQIDQTKGKTLLSKHEIHFHAKPDEIKLSFTHKNRTRERAFDAISEQTFREKNTRSCSSNVKSIALILIKKFARGSAMKAFFLVIFVYTLNENQFEILISDRCCLQKRKAGSKDNGQKGEVEEIKEGTKGGGG